MANAEKLNIDSENPKYSTNWCDIPMEMRSECIKWMDVQTRMQLRQTSKTEKSLVASAKNYQLACLRVYAFSGYLCVFIGKDYGEEAFSPNLKNFMRRVVTVLEHCEISFFRVKTDKEQENAMWTIWALRNRNVRFRFKTIRASFHGDDLLLKFFCGNCDGLENVCLDKENGYLTKNLFNTPSVINANLFQLNIFRKAKADRSIFKLVEKWIENDSEIGKKMNLKLGTWIGDSGDEPTVLFESIFKDRVISKDEEHVRIRTDTNTKHILLKNKIVDNAIFCAITIVSSAALEHLNNDNAFDNQNFLDSDNEEDF